MHCWHDKNPVHVLSIADSTKIEEVKCKQGKDQIIVKCPSNVKNYNINMQAVDQFNKLMSLFFCWHRLQKEKIEYCILFKSIVQLLRTCT